MRCGSPDDSLVSLVFLLFLFHAFEECVENCVSSRTWGVVLFPVCVFDLLFVCQSLLRDMKGCRLYQGYFRVRHIPVLSETLYPPYIKSQASDGLVCGSGEVCLLFGA